MARKSKLRKPENRKNRKLQKITTEIILKKETDTYTHIQRHRNTNTEEKAIIFTTNREGEYI